MESHKEKCKTIKSLNAALDAMLDAEIAISSSGYDDTFREIVNRIRKLQSLIEG